MALTYYGDEYHSERLVRASLNLLPSASHDVRAYGDEIRRAYAKVSGSSGGEGIEAEGTVMHRLFRGVTPSAK